MPFKPACLVQMDHRLVFNILVSLVNRLLDSLTGPLFQSGDRAQTEVSLKEITHYFNHISFAQMVAAA
jgi:hypothetical protein